MTNQLDIADEAALIYAVHDFCDVAEDMGFIDIFSACVNELNRRRYPFNDIEKDIIGDLLIMKDGV